MLAAASFSVQPLSHWPPPDAPYDNRPSSSSPSSLYLRFVKRVGGLVKSRNSLQPTHANPGHNHPVDSEDHNNGTVVFESLPQGGPGWDRGSAICHRTPSSVNGSESHAGVPAAMQDHMYAPVSGETAAWHRNVTGGSKSRSLVTLSDVDAQSKLSKPSGYLGPYSAGHKSHFSGSRQDSWDSLKPGISYIPGENYGKLDLAKRATKQRIKLHMITVDLFPDDDLPLFCKTIDEFWHQAAAGESSLDPFFLEQDMREILSHCRQWRNNVIKAVASVVWESFKLELYKPKHVLLTTMQTLLADGNFGSGVRINTATGQAYTYDDGELMIDGPWSDPCILTALEIIFDKLGWIPSTRDVFASLKLETLASAYLVVHFGLEYQVKVIKLTGKPLGSQRWDHFEAGRPMISNLNTKYQTYKKASQEYSEIYPENFASRKDELWKALDRTNPQSLSFHPVMLGPVSKEQQAALDNEPELDSDRLRLAAPDAI